MSADQPCTDCDKPATYTRAERLIGIVGLAAGIVIGYMAIDIVTSGGASAWLGRLFGRGGLGSEAETYLKAAQHDRRG